MSTQRYLVTARKYRPQIFSELVSQEHVTETLKNAIRLDRLAHAYLFSGPRGVGKTTAARVLAKAINCTKPLEERVDQAEPCRECDSCRSFEEGRSLSIIEIDAASNNKVDDVRELRDTVRIPPQGSRKKVYIVDEVHMLSQSAFNALLKTLEEPPPYALFIFATTEPNKVLPTILSRCQRFDFRRIPVAEIVGHLRQICEIEGVTADDASLLLIARKGDGALRDALSAFDQAVSLCGLDLRYAELAEALRVVDVDLYFRLTDHIVSGNSAGVLQLVDEVVRGGYDLQEFLAGVAEHLRNVLVARTMSDANLIEATEETRKRFSVVAEALGEADLLRMLTVADEADRTIRNSVQPRLKLELALLKMTSLPRSTDLRAIIAKIDALERGERDEASSAAKSTAPPTSSRRTTSQDSASTTETTRPIASSAAVAAAPSPTGELRARPANVHELTPGGRRDVPVVERSVPAEPPNGPRVRPQNDPNPRPQRGTDAPGAAAAPKTAEAPALFGSPALRRRTEPQSRPTGEERGGKAMFDGSGALATAPDPEEVDVLPAPGIRTEEWEAAVRQVHADRIHVGALLQHCKPADYRNETLTVAVPDDFHRRLLGSQDEYLIEQFATGVTPSVRRIRFVVREALQQNLPSETAAQIDPLEYFNRKREENPVVRAIFEQFGGELVW